MAGDFCTCTGAPGVYCPWCMTMLARQATPSPSAPPRTAQAPQEASRAAAEPAETEKGFMGRVVRLAKTHGWLCYHTHRSDKSAPGFPDVVLCKPASLSAEGRLVFAELKSRTGKLTVEQAQWLDVLRHTGRCEVYVWRPTDWEELVAILTKKEDTPCRP